MWVHYGEPKSFRWTSWDLNCYLKNNWTVVNGERQVHNKDNNFISCSFMLNHSLNYIVSLCCFSSYVFLQSDISLRQTTTLLTWKIVFWIDTHLVCTSFRDLGTLSPVSVYLGWAGLKPGVGGAYQDLDGLEEAMFIIHWKAMYIQ